MSGEHPFNDSPDLFVPLLDTYNPMDIAFIKSLLDDTGIDYFFHGEHFNAVHPMAQPARLMVRRDQAEEAMGLIRELKLHYISASPQGERGSEDEAPLEDGQE